MCSNVETSFVVNILMKSNDEYKCRRDGAGRRVWCYVEATAPADMYVLCRSDGARRRVWCYFRFVNH